MKISKCTYLLIASFIYLSFWNLNLISTLINNDMITLMAYIWSIIGFTIKKDKLNIPNINFTKYNWIWIVFLIGVFVSMINAELFWNQPIKTTFLAQRNLYSIILLPALFSVQPSASDILKTLKIVSYITVSMWIISIFYPQLFSNISENMIELKDNETTDIGYYINGINIVVLYTYYKIQNYVQNFNYKKFFNALFWIIFIFLYQNRSLMIGVIIIFLYSIFKMKSRHKIIIFCIVIILTILFVTFTSNIWTALIEETNSQLNDEDYNRWKALYYYIYEYSPNSWCFIFGNGMPSIGNSYLGFLYSLNKSNGIYTSDLGMFGCWVHFGIISFICIYIILFKALLNKNIPLWHKFMCIHIILIPTIFTYHITSGILYFVIIIYLYCYYNEISTKVYN